MYILKKIYVNICNICKYKMKRISYASSRISIISSSNRIMYKIYVYDTWLFDAIIQ